MPLGMTASVEGGILAGGSVGLREGVLDVGGVLGGVLVDGAQARARRRVGVHASADAEVDGCFGS